MVAASEDPLAGIKKKRRETMLSMSSSSSEGIDGNMETKSAPAPGELASTTLRASRSAIQAPEQVHELLDHLHELSTAQEATIAYPTGLDLKLPETRAALDYLMRDKFIALDQDKCHFVYNLLRAMGAVNVVEAGTSYGVSTIYLALAVGQNLKAGKGKSAKVIATENEPEKAQVARQHWEECGPEVSSYIQLREGDILQTLKEDLPEVDLLLLDIWTPMAMPVLKLVMPKLKRGAVVITDNSVRSAEGYGELLALLRAPNGPFRSFTLPYTNGLEMSTYLP